MTDKKTNIRGSIESNIQCRKADLTNENKVGRWDGTTGDFYFSSRACFSVLTKADAIFCWEIKEGRCKWVKERQRWETSFSVVSPDFILHLHSHVWGQSLQTNKKKSRTHRRKHTYCISIGHKKNMVMQMSTVLLNQPVRRTPTGWWWSEASSHDLPPHSGSPPGTGL